MLEEEIGCSEEWKIGIENGACPHFHAPFFLIIQLTRFLLIDIFVPFVYF